LNNKADTKTGMPAQKLYSEACENYRAALKIEPNNHMTLNNLGLAIFKLSQTKSGKVDDEQYEQIFSMYKAALKINSDEYIVLYN
jgi:tetratricopeptide (TPR) repeat protein